MTDAELQAYSVKHLYYEVWMLQETAKRLLHDMTIHQDRVMKNAMVESCCIHARALSAFLYPERFARRDGDVTAEAYVLNMATWLDERGEMPDILVIVKDRTGKEIAHLTTDRKEYDDPDKEWPLDEIVAALRAQLKSFIGHAAPVKLSEFVVGYIAGLQRPMEQSRIVIHEVGSTGLITASGPSFSAAFSTDSQVVIRPSATDVRTRGTSEST
jgi:hypothetical protein